jgi:hypothetical protein
MLVKLIPYLILVTIVAYIGRDRKFGFWGNFFASLLFTPLVGLVLIFASDKRPTQAVAPAPAV